MNERHIRQARARQKCQICMDKVESKRSAAHDVGDGWLARQQQGDRAGKGEKDVLQTPVLFSGLNLTLWHGERGGWLAPTARANRCCSKQLLDPEAISGG
ncbi:MAG: hypothetical protein IPK53_19435 [bacterium]|nr:hypothetical protein [bacterium]